MLKAYKCLLVILTVIILVDYNFSLNAKEMSVKGC